MLKVQEIRELIKLVDQSSLDEFVYEIDGSKIKMKKNTAEAVVTTKQAGNSVEAGQGSQPEVVEPAAVKEDIKVEKEVVSTHETPAQPEDDSLHKITSPMVGTFYQSPSPDADPYVKPGSKVTKDSIVCIVEAMKLFNEIEAEINGEIVDVLVKDGQLVEYGQPLFLVKPE